MSLTKILEENLPLGSQVDVYKFCTSNTLKRRKVLTYLFVVVQGELVIYAAEILVYLDPALVTLYVSKVDTTGNHNTSKSPISGLTQSVLTYLLVHYSCIGPVRLTLFARSQPQYLFPCSSGNKNKHVLGDRALLRWWMNVLDKSRVHLADGSLGYVLAPGFDSAEVQRYIPRPGNWRVGHPYNDAAMAVDEIGVYPDDPKGRFIDELVVEKQAETTTVAQFWEQMAYRQEMSSGHMIGFISLVLNPSGHTASERSELVAPLDGKIYKQIFRALHEGDYGNADLTLTSTQHWKSTVLALLQTYKPENVVGSKKADAPTPLIVRADQDVSSGNVLPVKRLAGECEQVHILQPRKRTPKASPSALNINKTSRRD